MTQTSLTELKHKESLPVAAIGFTDSRGFELVQRAGNLLSSSSIVPKEYQGNLPNCVVALNMANRIGADPLMVMQNLVIVHGRPTWSAQFLIATANKCGRFTALSYEFFGERGTDSWGCRVWAIEKSTGAKLVGTDVTIKLAKDEGWYNKNGSKWKTMPQQMLMYRAASWWTRVYAPELSMGLHTTDEMRDTYDAEKQEDGSYTVNMDTLKDSINAQVVDANDVTVVEATQQNTVAAASTLEEGDIVSSPSLEPDGEPIAPNKPPLAAAPAQYRRVSMANAAAVQAPVDHHVVAQ